MHCFSMAANKGLWSVKRVKGRPSRKKWKILAERNAARNSLSFGKESKGLPGSKGLLLEDSSHMGLGGISGQGKGS